MYLERITWGWSRQVGGRRAAAIPVAAGLGAHQPDRLLHLAAEQATGSSGTRHGVALLGALETSLRTRLAVVSLVLGTPIAAGLADLRAQRADGSRVLAVARHGVSRQAADRSTVRVQGNAARHHLYVVLFQTSREALMASRGAHLASLDARRVLVRGVVHKNLLISSSKDEREPAQLAARSLNLLSSGVFGAVG